MKFADRPTFSSVLVVSALFTACGSASAPGGISSDAGGANTGTGGDSATGSDAGCNCTDIPITWGLIGGFMVVQSQSTLSCSGFSRNVPSSTAAYQCHTDLDCVGWKRELDAIAQALASSDVQQALAQAPILYGVDLRAVDGGLLLLSVGDKKIQVGSSCPASTTGCTDAPAGVTALIQALDNLVPRASMTCSPECLPQLGVTPATCAASDKYYRLNSSANLCGLLTNCTCQGPNCATGFDTEAACESRPLQCRDLYNFCGGLAGNTCTSDEYCAYLGDSAVCGKADAYTVCLPRPRSCPPSTSSPVCGCDGKVYESACAAAMAGHGLDMPAACNLAP